MNRGEKLAEASARGRDDSLDFCEHARPHSRFYDHATRRNKISFVVDSIRCQVARPQSWRMASTDEQDSSRVAKGTTQT